MKIKTSFLLILVLSVTFFAGNVRGASSDQADPSPGELLVDNGAIPKEFIRRQGNLLIVGSEDQQITLRGVCFGNNVWSNPSMPPTSHHGENDFQRVRDMGMNVIRFYLNYRLFEEDGKPYHYKQSGWDWLDRNIAWAKSQNIYLILNIHVPQGGFQSNGDGMVLWDVPENQKRLTALWRAIADHCKNEPTVAGYDLLNEPIVSISQDQWKNLALRLAVAIREVDRSHLLIVERTNGVKGQWETYGGLNFFLLNDANTMYTFHFYSPIEYSHQNSWTGLPADGSYPDESIIMAPSDATWYTAIFNNPKIPEGNSDWTYYEGVDYHAVDPKLLVGKPAFVARNTGRSGAVYFDDFVIKEYDENHNFIRDIFSVDVTSANGWSYWSHNGSGSHSFSTSKGHSSGNSIRINGTTDDANVSNNNYRFPVVQGHYYRISGWIRGEKIASGSGCQMRIDFETSPSGGQIYPRNKEYLDSVLVRFLEWGRQNNVPMYLGEFGLYKDCFASGKGGLSWVGDMVDLLKVHNVHFTYHTYHESAFGIYPNDNSLPDPAKANQGLIDLFKRKL